jgi:NAD(P)H-quinone oxidoreductase subunit 5
MHAGVINAGGFLLIRLSPLVALSPPALHWLAIVGSITALWGASVMLTQTSIKRALAYSTLAQMGFMMLQCGLGMFTAAFLHLLGHSCYKAYAFLNSGSVLTAASALQMGRPASVLSSRSALLVRITALASACIAIGSAALVWGAHGSAGLGLWVLSAVLALALATLLIPAFANRSTRVRAIGFAIACGVAHAYFIGYRLLDTYLADTVAHAPLQNTPVNVLLSIGLIGLFAMVWWWQSSLALRPSRSAAASGAPTGDGLATAGWPERFYVHTLNGFYFDVWLRRMQQRFIGGSTDRDAIDQRAGAAGRLAESAATLATR